MGGSVDCTVVPLGSSSGTEDPGFGGRIEPHAKPQFEHQERPEPWVMISGRAAMFVEQAAEVVRPEKAALA